jgi:predicted DNA binding CopG/RHH family protein
MREKGKLLRQPAVKEYFKNMEAVINKYLGQEATEDDIQQVARNFEIKVGWNKARMITRRLAKTERRKLKGLESDEKERQQGIVDALEIAVDFVARRRRDKKPKKAMDRFLRISRKVAGGFNLSGLYEEFV